MTLVDLCLRRSTPERQRYGTHVVAGIVSCPLGWIRFRDRYKVALGFNLVFARGSLGPLVFAMFSQRPIPFLGFLFHSTSFMRLLRRSGVSTLSRLSELTTPAHNFIPFLHRRSISIFDYRQFCFFLRLCVLSVNLHDCDRKPKSRDTSIFSGIGFMRTRMSTLVGMDLGSYMIRTRRIISARRNIQSLESG